MSNPNPLPFARAVRADYVCDTCGHQSQVVAETHAPAPCWREGCAGTREPRAQVVIR